MYQARWDRLLETCYRRGSDLVFIPGSPPLVRTDRQWQRLQLPRLCLEEVRWLASEALKVGPLTHSEGYTYCDFWYGDVANFRAMAFGFPETSVFMVTRLCAPSPGEELIKVDLPNTFD